MQHSSSQVTSFHTTTTTAWDAMLHACMQAESSIDLEEFIFKPDSIGTRFCDVLSEKAEQGVTVRLLLDWWGCRDLKDSELAHQLEQAGVTIRYFRTAQCNWLLHPTRFFPRDHRKVLIIDTHSVFAGGVCIYDDIKDWRDTMFQATGGLAQQYQHIFDRTWYKSSGDSPEVTAHPDFETDAQFSVYANAPDSNEYYFTDLLINRITNARHSIKLVTPYFTPNKRLIRVLYKALARGVTVTILLSNYSKYSPYVVGKYMCGDLISHGAKIYYYEPTMLHLKMMIIDDQWSAIGSCNLDGLSIQQNQEAMLVSTQDHFTQQLCGHFDTDKKQSVRFSYADWQSRPISQKIVGWACYPFRKYL